MGAESLATSSKPVDGLPQRDEINKWIHDIDEIATETEKFDQGDMNRLKEFAKGEPTCIRFPIMLVLVQSHIFLISEIATELISRRH